MGVFFGTTEITGMHFGEQEITEIFFGNTEIFSVWAEYDGALPAQYSANGENLVQYQVYGNTGGVGDKTGNAYETDLDAPKGYYASDGTLIQNNSYESSKKISCNANDVLTVSAVSTMAAECVIQIVFLNSEQDFIVIHSRNESGTGEKVHYVTAPSNAKYAFVVLMSSFTNKMLVLGSTVPASYVPYGYEVDMSVSDGTTSTTTPIYIGDTPLGEDEYVDYGEGKVYRRNPDNVFDYTQPISWSSISIGQSSFVPTQPGTEYSFGATSKLYTRLSFFNGSSRLSASSWATSALTATTPINCTKIAIEFRNRTYTAVTEEQKQTVHECVVNVGSKLASLTVPTDPPVTLPALPTVDGTNITDYAGQSAAVPSEFYAKYRKEGF